MYKSSNPESQSILNELASLVCDQLRGQPSLLEERSDALLKSLLMSGYLRQEETPLTRDIRDRVEERCHGLVQHRGVVLSSLLDRINDKFEKLVREESTQPTDNIDASKAANISAATRA